MKVLLITLLLSMILLASCTPKPEPVRLFSITDLSTGKTYLTNSYHYPLIGDISFTTIEGKYVSFTGDFLIEEQ